MRYLSEIRIKKIFRAYCYNIALCYGYRWRRLRAIHQARKRMT